MSTRWWHTPESAMVMNYVEMVCKDLSDWYTCTTSVISVTLNTLLRRFKYTNVKKPNSSFFNEHLPRDWCWNYSVVDDIAKRCFSDIQYWKWQRLYYFSFLPILVYNNFEIKFSTEIYISNKPIETMALKFAFWAEHIA